MSETVTWSALARSSDGSVVHRADCRHARVPWRWADGKPPWVVADTVRNAPWLKPCRLCKPFDEDSR